MIVKKDINYDLLKSVYQKKYNEEEAQTIITFITDLYHNGNIISTIDKALLLNKFEYTAIVGNSAPIELVAKWRYDDWPDICIICKNPLNFRDFHWRYYEDNEGIEKGIAHIHCIP